MHFVGAVDEARGAIHPFGDDVLGLATGAAERDGNVDGLVQSIGAMQLFAADPAPFD
jgi:hypothetical protein